MSCFLLVCKILRLVCGIYHITQTTNKKLNFFQKRKKENDEKVKLLEQETETLRNKVEYQQSLNLEQMKTINASQNRSANQQQRQGGQKVLPYTLL